MFLKEVTIIGRYLIPLIGGQPSILETVTDSGSFPGPVKNYKSDNAYQLYMCGHVSDVRLCQCDSNYMYVKGSCIPETRQAERPYDSWILLDNTGSIHSGGCTCVADDGSCKHCIALVLAVQNFCERHQDRNTEVGTDSGCKWDKPRKRSEPTLLKDIQYGKQEQCREIFTPNKEELESKSQKSLENMVYRLCKGTNALFLQTTEPPSDDSDSDSDDEELQNFSDMVNCVKKQCGSNFQCIINELSKKHTSEYIAKVENSTKGQHENELWFKHRQGRITASLAHSVLKCNLEKLKPENYIVRSIKGNTLPFSTAATKYGKDMEKVAYSMYVTKVRHSHKKFVPSSCGLFISKEFPFLAASPDGKVECLCCGKGLLEIKCSYSFRHKTPLEVASDKDYYLYVQDGEVRLKKNTSWYTQIQTQLGVCELQYCDFVFFTLKGIAVERIYFDTDIYTQIKEKSNLFVQKYLL